MLKVHKTANTAWIQALSDCIHNSSTCESRGLKFRELTGYSISFNMKFPVITVPERKLGVRFLPAEAYWILSGSNKVSGIERYSKMIGQFSDDGIHFDGAYGPMVMDQMRYVCDCLKKDKGSRQAVITIWRPNPRESKDIPCTIGLQFMIRHNALHCIATMRSSDLWLGWVYDAFNFTMITTYLQCLLAQRDMHVGLGNLTIQAGSEHLYSSDLDKALAVFNKYDGFLTADYMDSLFIPVKIPDARTLDHPEDLLAWLKMAMNHEKGIMIGEHL